MNDMDAISWTASEVREGLAIVQHTLEVNQFRSEDLPRLIAAFTVVGTVCSNIAATLREISRG